MWKLKRYSVRSLFYTQNIESVGYNITAVMLYTYISKWSTTINFLIPEDSNTVTKGSDMMSATYWRIDLLGDF